MDELPRHARDIVRLARDQHDCTDEQARDRVREAVANSVSRGAVGASGLSRSRAVQVANKSGPLASFGAKLAITTVAFAIVAAGLALQVRKQRAHDAESAQASADRQPSPSVAPSTPAGAAEHPAEPRAAEQPQPATHAPALAPAAQNPRRARGNEGRGALTARERRAETGTLDAEIELLRRVSEAVARGELRLASDLLAQHRQRFARPTLLEEREGFQAIVRCMGSKSGGSALARSFLARYPEAVLAGRVARACDADGAAP